MTKRIDANDKRLAAVECKRGASLRIIESVAPVGEAGMRDKSCSAAPWFLPMSKYLRTLRCAVLTAALLLLSFVPARSQQIQLEVAHAIAIRNIIGNTAISVTLSPESRRAFAALSKEVAGRFIEIRGAGRVLAIDYLGTSIEDGVLEFIARDGNAAELARKLSGNAARLEVRVLEEKR